MKYKSKVLTLINHESRDYSEAFFYPLISPNMEVLGVEPRASYMLSTHSTIELHPIPAKLISFILEVSGNFLSPAKPLVILRTNLHKL